MSRTCLIVCKRDRFYQIVNIDKNRFLNLEFIDNWSALILLAETNGKPLWIYEIRAASAALVVLIIAEVISSVRFQEYRAISPRILHGGNFDAFIR